MKTGGFPAFQGGFISQYWIPLMEYAVQTGVSLSTLRRYIKAGKIEFKVEKGRYLIAHGAPTAGPATKPVEYPGHVPAAAPAAPTSDLVSSLKSDLNKAREEISELKTLIALYEEGLSHPPSSP
jgi:hypothetical protein